MDQFWQLIPVPETLQFACQNQGTVQVLSRAELSLNWHYQLLAMAISYFQMNDFDNFQFH